MMETRSELHYTFLAEYEKRKGFGESESSGIILFSGESGRPRAKFGGASYNTLLSATVK